MFDDVIILEKTAASEITGIKSIEDLGEFETKFLGRKGSLTVLFEKIGTLPQEERKSFGEAINGAKKKIEDLVAKKRDELKSGEYKNLAETEWIDVTSPSIAPPEGHLHLVTQAIREVTHIFERVGFNRVRYPEVEWDWFAFEALNMPSDHPARDEWETFFMNAPENDKFGKMVLTPHTSSGQIREMLKGELPIRMINISKCYRRQSDVTHVPMFHQFEGLMIDKDVSITHLKGVLDYFAREFFGPERKTRLRPYHFRFTEPSFEVDISCGICGGTGKSADGAKCRLCKSGWLELGGAGMVHPNVLRACKIDPAKWNGFAFGWGVERTAMMRSGLRIEDIRILYKNDLRFLKQF